MVAVRYPQHRSVPGTFDQTPSEAALSSEENFRLFSLRLMETRGESILKILGRVAASRFQAALGWGYKVFRGLSGGLDRVQVSAKNRLVRLGLL